MSWKADLSQGLNDKLIGYEEVDDLPPLPYQDNYLLWDKLNLTPKELNKTLNVVEQFRSKGKKFHPLSCIVHHLVLLSLSCYLFCIYHDNNQICLLLSFSLGAWAVGGVPSDVVFEVELEFKHSIISTQISVKRNLIGQDFLKAIHSQVYSANALPEAFLNDHKLRLASGVGVASASAVPTGDTLYLHIPDRLSRVCGSRWIRSNLKELGIDDSVPVNDLKSFLDLLVVSESVHSCSTHLAIADELTALAAGTFNTYTQRSLFSSLRSEDSQYDLHRKPLTKALYLLNKHSKLESLVDNFISLLLNKVGFNKGMLAVAPKLGLKIVYGNQDTVDAIADFCIVDVLNNVIFVVTAERPNDVDSLPQMVAECIAAHCSNEMLREAVHEAKVPRLDIDNRPVPPRIVGLRICATRFNFYVMEISESIARALQSGMTSNSKNNLYQFTCGRSVDNAGFDFMVNDDRKVILEVLCKLQCHFMELEEQTSRSRATSIIS